MISWEFSENFQKKLLQWLSSFLLFRAAQKRKKNCQNLSIFKFFNRIPATLLLKIFCADVSLNTFRKFSENVCFQNTPGRLFLGKHMKHVVCHASHSMHVEIILKIYKLPH